MSEKPQTKSKQPKHLDEFPKGVQDSVYKILANFSKRKQKLKEDKP